MAKASMAIAANLVQLQKVHKLARGICEVESERQELTVLYNLAILL